MQLQCKQNRSFICSFSRCCFLCMPVTNIFSLIQHKHMNLDCRFGFPFLYLLTFITSFSVIKKKQLFLLLMLISIFDSPSTRKQFFFGFIIQPNFQTNSLLPLSCVFPYCILLLYQTYILLIYFYLI